MKKWTVYHPTVPRMYVLVFWRPNDLSIHVYAYTYYTSIMVDSNKHLYPIYLAHNAAGLKLSDLKALELYSNLYMYKQNTV